MHTTRIQSGTLAFRRVNLALFAAGFVTFITLYDMQPLLPEFVREFSIPPALASLPLSAACFTLAVGMLLAGTLSETLGRKSIMVTSLFLTSILALCTAWSDSLFSLVFLRFIQGIVLAGLPPVAMAYLGEEIEPATIGTAMGLYISGNAIGGMSGRLFTATITDYFSWNTALVLVGLISLGLSIYFALHLPASQQFTKRNFEYRYLFSSLYLKLRDPHLLCLYGISFCVMGSFVTLFNYITFRLIGPVYDLSQSMVSLIFLTYLLGAYCSSVVNKMVKRYGRFTTLRSCLITMLLGLVITLSAQLFAIIFGIALFTCGFFGAHTSGSTWVGQHAQTAKAQAAALYLFFYYLGSSISGTVGGFCWTGGGWMGVTLFIAVLLVIASGLTLVLARLGNVDNALE
ncbi:MFS transporter [Desulfobulbus rhabdoformis]|uniref:MFS transporter n=1 Tax=Desulfobulbus rhabdoformis TaxID=34032 RepID=UPI001966B522|nr:MFS transporter [Desulfobulbus rhabdoformis]MBM9616349.1 MFS transporter [Desulfobulbus rhabdoformis]